MAMEDKVPYSVPSPVKHDCLWRYFWVLLPEQYGYPGGKGVLHVWFGK